MNNVVIGMINGFVQAFVVYFTVFLLNPNKYSVFKKILLYVLIGIYLTISSLFIPNEIRFFFYIMMSTICISLTLKTSLYESSIFGTISLFLASTAEIAVSIVISLLGYDIAKQINDPFFNLLVCIIISIFAIVLLVIMKKLFIKLCRFLTKSRKIMISIYLAMILLYFLLAKNALFSKLGFSLALNLIILGFFILLFVIIVNKEIKSQKLKEENIQSMNYINKYEKIITEQGKANHEFKNQLMVIRGYAQSKSPKLIEYLDSVIDDTKKLKSTYLISQLNKFPDGGIKGLLYYKLSIMEEEKIKYNIYADEACKAKSKKLTPSQIKNITKILGVLLDNAIEASKDSKDKLVDIALINKRGMMVFVITNSYSGKINKFKIGSGYTTKGKGHGYGLRLVKDIISQEEYVNYETNTENKNYTVKLEIKILSKKPTKM